MRDTAPKHPAHVLRQQMGRPLDMLCFSPALEREVASEIWEVQRRSALFTLMFMGAVWLTYMGVDLWRFRQLNSIDQEWDFLLGVVVGRVVVLICFLCTLLALLNKGVEPSVRTGWMVTSVLTCSAAVLVSSYTLRNLGMHETSVVMLLTVVVALSPLGVRMREAVPVALFICVMSALAGPMMLHRPEHLVDHWVLVVMMWVTLVLCSVTGYYREKAQRHQYLLRKLLDWEACHDPLTALPNRRLFREHFQRTWLHARREKLSVYLAVLDIDHFKLYNDRYGHLAGDEVLCVVAGLLGDYARRPLDLAVRLGGEEFALLVLDEQPISVAHRMEQLRLDLQAMNLKHEASLTAPCVTISIGVAQMREDDTLDSVFSIADALLYEAKSQGRNRVRSDLHRGERALGSSELHA